jgi:DNA modification methylase
LQVFGREQFAHEPRLIDADAQEETAEFREPGKRQVAATSVAGSSPQRRFGLKSDQRYLRESMVGGHEVPDSFLSPRGHAQETWRRKNPAGQPPYPPSQRLARPPIMPATMTAQTQAIATAPDLGAHLPPEVAALADPQTDIPRIAKEPALLRQIEAAVRGLPSAHRLVQHDARDLGFLPDASVHLIVTSPPYWTLKKYRHHEQQLGDLDDYETFLAELDKVWRHCYRVLVPGGRLVCVVGDVCLSRRKNSGRHTVVPLHASIQEHCRTIGYDNLAPIIWHKIANAVYEATGNGGGFLGKPFEPNAVIKNDIEFILMERKPGGYRSPSLATRVLSVISAENHRQWFQAIWTGVTGASTRQHPAPYPEELAERLVRMFSFVGDTVLDPFAGTGTTTVAAAKWGRNSIGVEIDPHYCELAERRIRQATESLFSSAHFEVTSE